MERASSERADTLRALGLALVKVSELEGTVLRYPKSPVWRTALAKAYADCDIQQDQRKKQWLELKTLNVLGGF